LIAQFDTAEEPLNEEPERVAPSFESELATDPALPEVFWFNVGISPATIALHVGAPDPEVGPIKAKFCDVDGKAFRKTSIEPHSHWHNT